MRQNHENGWEFETGPRGEPALEALQEFQVGLAGGVARLHYQEDEIRLTGRLLGGLELVLARSGVAVTDGVEQHQAAGDIGRLELIAGNVGGSGEDIRPRQLLTQESVDQARFPRLDLAEDGNGHARGCACILVSRGGKSAAVARPLAGELAIATGAHAQAAAIEVDQIGSEALQISGIEPDQEVLL